MKSNAAMKKALRMPPDDQIQIAVMWLFHNDGIGAEEDACKSVAKWLEQEVAERALRSAARQAGLPLAVARERIAQANATEYAP